MGRLAVSVRCVFGQATVRPAGELELANAARLDAAIRDLRGRCRAIEIDLGAVTFIDSTGIRLLLTCWRESERDGIDLSLLPGPPIVMRALTVAGLVDELPFDRRAPQLSSRGAPNDGGPPRMAARRPIR